MEPEHCDQLPILPIEMILEIISNLNTIEDITNCMLLSKEIKTSMLKSTKIMRNIRFNLKRYHESDITMKIFKEHAKFIRCMNITSFSCNDNFKDALNQIPNLEDLSFESKLGIRCLPLSTQPSNKKLSDYWNDYGDSSDLTKLKALKIDVRDLTHFLKLTKNVKNLEKLTIFSYDSTHEDFMFDFICQQHNLKELNVINHENIYLSFPKVDPTSKVKFRLKKFKVLTKWDRAVENEHFSKFLAFHAESLEELEVDYSLSTQSLQLIFEKSNKLQKLILSSDKNSQIYSRNHRDWTIPTVKHFEDLNSDGIDLEMVLRKFPNIERLRCDILNNSSKRPNNIKYLEMNTMNGYCIVRQEIMRNTLSDLKNLEHLVMLKLHTELFSRISKHFDVLEKLKTINYRVKSFNPNIIETDDNEIVPKDYKCYKIKADFEKKTVKVSTYIVHHDKELFKNIVKSFKGFDFFEFCFDVMKIKRIFTLDI
ncbi:hypothetical protein ACKWTF_012739 [Chironomus riparius]